jgi:flagellin-like hook-associated protein FlgL
VKTKISVLAVAAFLILGVTTPVQAATSGGSCSTAGAKTKIGKNNYICAKNPFFNTTKLTWVWDGCLEFNNDPEYITSKKEGIAALRQVELTRRNQIEPVGASLRDLIVWNSLITYKKSDVVYYGSTYYAATKSSINKAPTSANIGSTKFWVVHQPTNANTKIGQMPTPAKVITAATAQISALNSSASRTTSSTTKARLTALSSSLATKIATLEANRGQIDSVINTIDGYLADAKSVYTLIQSITSTIKDTCNPKN